MSYRTYINNTQIFGNNEWYQEWIDFIKSEGIEVGEDDDYDGYITNIHGLFSTINTIIKRLIDEQHQKVVNGETNWNDEPKKDLYNFTDSYNFYCKEYDGKQSSILDFNFYILNNSYLFIPYVVYKALEDILEHDEDRWNDDKIEWYRSYKLKDGEKIHVHAG